MRKVVIGLAAAFAMVGTAVSVQAADYGDGWQDCPCNAPTYGYAARAAAYVPTPGYNPILPDVSRTYAPRGLLTRYFHVNQGPTFSGPGAYAPEPVYRERAIGGWQVYGHAHYRYDGGPYGNAFDHRVYPRAHAVGPVIHTYRPRAHRVAVTSARGYEYGYTTRPHRARVEHGAYGYRKAARVHGRNYHPHVVYGSDRVRAPRHH